MAKFNYIALVIAAAFVTATACSAYSKLSYVGSSLVPKLLSLPQITLPGFTLRTRKIGAT